MHKIFNSIITHIGHFNKTNTDRWKNKDARCLNIGGFLLTTGRTMNDSKMWQCSEFQTVYGFNCTKRCWHCVCFLMKAKTKKRKNHEREADNKMNKKKTEIYVTENLCLLLYSLRDIIVSIFIYFCNLCLCLCFEYGERTKWGCDR